MHNTACTYLYFVHLKSKMDIVYPGICSSDNARQEITVFHLRGFCYLENNLQILLDVIPATVKTFIHVFVKCVRQPTLSSFNVVSSWRLEENGYSLSFSFANYKSGKPLVTLAPFSFVEGHQRTFCLIFFLSPASLPLTRKKKKVIWKAFFLHNKSFST